MPRKSKPPSPKMLDLKERIFAKCAKGWNPVPLLLTDDLKHSQREPRFHALGKTDQDRRLQVTFTERANGTLIRPISARTMSRKERAVYEQAIKAHS